MTVTLIAAVFAFQAHAQDLLPSNRNSDSINIGEALKTHKIQDGVVQELRKSGHVDVIIGVEWKDILNQCNTAVVKQDCWKKAYNLRKTHVMKSGGAEVTLLQDYDLLNTMFVRITSENALVHLANSNEVYSINLNQSYETQ